ncbi:MAG: SHOCT domain-containing protein [Candidatus Limiplasma sp.]|nr:SHOCT domain-containing protein [Candidatus Limiplasma sp.]
MDKYASEAGIIMLVIFGPIIIVCFCAAIYQSRRARAIKRNTEEFENQFIQSLSRQGFSIDKRFDFTPCRLLLDHQHRRGMLMSYSSPKEYYNTPMSTMQFFPLDKITECALVQDGTMVHHDAVIPGMVGAALFGLGGALAGATAMNKSENVGYLSVRLFIDDVSVSSLTITALNASAMKSSEYYLKAYDLAQQVYNEFEGIIRVNRARQNAAAKPVAPETHNEPAEDSIQANTQILDQIKRMAQLHAEGILTEEEFISKKQALLERMH